jgi:hypothetical protein
MATSAFLPTFLTPISRVSIARNHLLIKFEQVEALLGGRFVLSGGVDDIRLQFMGLWATLAGKLPPPSDAVTASM